MSNEVAHEGLLSVAKAGGFGRQPDLLDFGQVLVKEQAGARKVSAHFKMRFIFK